MFKKGDGQLKMGSIFDTWNRAKTNARRDAQRLVSAVRSQHAPNWIAAASALASAVAAGITYSVALEQKRLSAEVPFEQVLYQSKLQALADFRRVATQFDLDVRAAMVDLPLSVETPQDLGSIDDLHMHQLALAARPMMTKFHDFTSAAEGYGAIWGPGVRSALADMFAATMDDVRCFTMLGQHATGEPEYWAWLREAAAEPCSRLYDHSSHLKYLEMERQVENGMREELSTASDTRREPPAITEGYIRH